MNQITIVGIIIRDWLCTYWTFVLVHIVDVVVCGCVDVVVADVNYLGVLS